MTAGHREVLIAGAGPTGLRQALTRWCGAPAGQAAAYGR